MLVVANLGLSPFLAQNKCFGAGRRINLGHDQIIVTRATLCALEEQDELSRRPVGARKLGLVGCLSHIDTEGSARPCFQTS